MTFGLRIHLIVRETEEEAWSAADKLISNLSDEAVAAAQKRFAERDRFRRSEAHERAASAGPPRQSRDRPQPLGWPRARPRGRRTALVGDPKTVATRLREYQSVGIDTIIASGIRT